MTEAAQAAADPTEAQIMGLPGVRSRDLQVVEHVRTRHGGVFRLAGPSGSYLLKAVDAGKARKDWVRPLRRAQTIAGEIRAMRALNGVIGGHFVDGGRAGGVTWLLQRWIDGESAFDLAKRHRATRDLMPLLKLYAVQADLVARVHEAGWLHCDLQPMHFFHRPDEGVSLIDLGLARRQGDRATPFRGQLVHYASPEVARGVLNGVSQIPVDVRAEIYSFGAVLFVMHCGRTPTNYGGEASKVPSTEKMKRIVSGFHNKLATYGGRSLDVNEIIEQCLRRDPAERPASMREVADRLAAIVMRRRTMPSARGRAQQ